MMRNLNGREGKIPRSQGISIFQILVLFYSITQNKDQTPPTDVLPTSDDFSLPAIKVSHHARPTHINSDVGSARHRNREGFCRDQSHVPKYITEGRDRIRYITDLTEKNNFVILPRKGLACSRLRLLPSAVRL